MKPEFPQSLMINRITLRGPEMACLFEYARSEEEVAYEELQERFIPKQEPIFSKANDEILKDALGFLVSSGVLQIVRYSNSWQQRSFAVAEPYLGSKWSFELILANALKQQDEARQAALMDVYAHAIQHNLLHIQYSDLVQWIERSPLGVLFNWNHEKVHFWTQLLHYLGLVTSLYSNGCLFVPHPKRILEHLSWFAQTRKEPGFPVRDWCECWETEVATCLTRQNRLHQGYSQVLLLLEQQGKLSLRYRDDSSRSLLVGSRRVSEVCL
jgi:hypothetical protein